MSQVANRHFSAWHSRAISAKASSCSWDSIQRPVKHAAMYSRSESVRVIGVLLKERTMKDPIAASQRTVSFAARRHNVQQRKDGQTPYFASGAGSADRAASVRLRE